VGSYICGIAGVVKWGNIPISEETVRVLLVGNEHRGNDASGLVVQQEDGTLDVLKKDCPAWRFVTTNEYEQFIKDRLTPTSRSVLVHARGASQGSPRINNNNHPMYAGLSAIIHNGVIRNDDQLYTLMKLERKAETDSDAIRAIVDAYGLTKEALKNIGRATGSGAIAAVHPKFQDKLMLIRSGNPLTIASNDNFFYFSSEKATLHMACRPFVQRMGMWFQSQRPDVDFLNMPDNTGYIIGPKGLELHAEVRICQGSYNEPWRKTYEEYGKRQEKWDGQRNLPVLCKRVN
jgi:glucosamine 6-phosphate synthetase-like amidotransferase/phosphosugar isomerase protein